MLYFQCLKLVYIDCIIFNAFTTYKYRSVCRDRIRTTNNMLGDCYAAAIVEQLSRKELMALDALHVETPRPSTNGRMDEPVPFKDMVSIDLYDCTNVNK